MSFWDDAGEFIGSELLAPIVRGALADPSVQEELGTAAGQAAASALESQATQRLVLTVGGIVLLAALILRR